MIKVYHVKTPYTLKQHDVLLAELSDYMVKTYNAELAISLGEKIKINSEEANVDIADCNLIIEYTDSNTFKGITFEDQPSCFMDFFKKRNNPNDICLVSQYNPLEVNNYNNQDQIKRSIYVTASPFVDLDYYYHKRQEIKEHIDKFYFRGNLHNMGRYSAILLNENPYFHGGEGINPDLYFSDLINHKVGLSIPGIGEFCYRDIEYMAVGLPMMKFKYINELYYPLIPNYHYISIDRIDDDMVHERNGGQKYVDAYINRFLEVKDDKDFLNFISKNAREYYENHLHSSSRLNTIKKILDI
jgi:hypothetical protein